MSYDSIKTLKLIMFFAILLMCGCIKKDDGSKDVGVKTEYMIGGLHKHSLWLGFQDASGNDLLKGSEFVWENPNHFGLRDTVKPELYTLEYVFEKGIPNPWKFESMPPAIYEERYPRIYLAGGWILPEFLADTDYKYLWFEAESFRFFNNPEGLLRRHPVIVHPTIKDAYFTKKIIFRLTCHYLFGDNKAHDIVTWWVVVEGRWHPICYRVEFEGKDFPVSELYVATIILNR